ncbi:MAG: hypothetical protein ACAH59_10390, partial [Pseudobdellovibrionaceae bacterium]
MIKFWTHRYELTPWQTIGAVAEARVRQGALLKVQWPSDQIGYADIFPWPEYGDAPIEQQIEALAKGKISGLVEQAIWLAKKDAKLRSQNKNAFTGAAKIKNHFLITDYTRFSDVNMR